MSRKKSGPPSRFRPEFIEQAAKLCKLGATDRELGDFFGVSEWTINKWKADFPDFMAALTRGKKEADDRVEHSLYRRALGYTYDSVHLSNYQGVITQTPIVEHCPPDTTACIFWLKNRRPDLWRDRHEHTGADGGPIETRVSDQEIARRIAFVLQQGAQKSN